MYDACSVLLSVQILPNQTHLIQLFSACVCVFPTHCC